MTNRPLTSTPANNTGYYPNTQDGEGKWTCGTWAVVVETTTIQQFTNYSSYERHIIYYSRWYKDSLLHKQQGLEQR